MIQIKAEHEDLIYPVREFVIELGKVQDERFDKLYKKLVADGFPPDERSKDILFEYVYYSDPEKDPFTFEEFCDHDYKREYWRKQKYSPALRKYLL